MIFGVPTLYISPPGPFIQHIFTKISKICVEFDMCCAHPFLFSPLGILTLLPVYKNHLKFVLHMIFVVPTLFNIFPAGPFIQLLFE
jgi:hypothetical protein